MSYVGLLSLNATCCRVSDGIYVLRTSHLFQLGFFVCSSRDMQFFRPLMLPFDSVILPFSGGLRRRIAEQAVSFETPPSSMKALQGNMHRQQPVPFPLVPSSASWAYSASKPACISGFGPDVTVESVSLPARQPKAHSLRHQFLLLPPMTPYTHAKSSCSYASCTKASRASTGSRSGKLILGYFTSDFIDHPTAHMIEGLFRYHDRRAVVPLALSVGRSDASDYSARLKLLPAAFFDMSQQDFMGTAQSIAAAGVHILFDLLVHLKSKYLSMTYHTGVVEVQAITMLMLSAPEFVSPVLQVL